MSQHSSHCGTLVVSLDVAGSLSAEARRLIRLLQTYHVRATWAVGARTNLADILEVAAVGEVAILAEPDWANGEVGRGRFAAALAERRQQAAAAGMTLATLALRGVATLSHLDVAAKYGIRAIRGDAGRIVRRGEGPRRLRFGVWHMPVAVAVAATRGSWWTNHLRTALGAVDRAIASGGICHVQADVQRPEVIAVLEPLLRHVQQRRIENLIRVETIGDLAARLSQPRVAARPARSILRVA